jgi:hypothetical protein
LRNRDSELGEFPFGDGRVGSGALEVGVNMGEFLLTMGRAFLSTYVSQ